MKRKLSISAFFLLVFYLVGLFSPTIPFIEYLIQKDYIATVLCINKKKPELQCDGKCYLSQRIKEAALAQSASEHTAVSTTPPFLILGVVPIHDSGIWMPNFDENRGLQVMSGYTYLYTYHPFIPPRVVS